VVGVAYLWAWIGIQAVSTAPIWILGWRSSRASCRIRSRRCHLVLQIHRELEEAPGSAARVFSAPSERSCCLWRGGRDRLDDAGYLCWRSASLAPRCFSHQQHMVMSVLLLDFYEGGNLGRPRHSACTNRSARRSHRRRQLAVARCGAGQRRAHGIQDVRGGLAMNRRVFHQNGRLDRHRRVSA